MPMVSGTGFVQDAAIAIVDSISFQRSHEEFLHQAPHKPVEITRRGRREFVLMNIEHHDWFRTTSLRRHRTAEAADIVIDTVERAAMNAGLMPLDAPLG